MRPYINVGAVAPGLTALQQSTCDKARGQAGQVGEQGTADNCDFASDGTSSKALAAMTARAALCGCTLHELADGGYAIGRWNYSRALPCLRAVGDLLRRKGARS